MKLGPWMPDLPEHGHKGLVTARNAYSGMLGYEPIKALSAVTAALPAAWKGGGAFAGLDGTVQMLAATSAALYTLTASTATSVHTVASTAPWYFAQFGNLVVCVNGGAPVKYTLSTSLAAALAGTPPTSQYVAIVKDFVILAGNSSAVNRVYNSAINNAEGWTVGTDQCDTQDLPDGGAITGLAGGEYGLAFQDSAITQFEYLGPPTIWSFRKVSNSIGALCHGSIAQHGRQTFFYSRRGFYRFADGEVSAIGRNKVDRTFRTTYSVSEISANIRCTIDPERSLVMWSMPDRIWVYNFETEMWSDVFITGIVGIATGQTASLTLEDIAVTYPSIEDVTPVFDDTYWRGGNPLLLIAYSDFKLHSFGSSSNLEAKFRLPQMEIHPGRTTHVRNSRLIGNMTSATVSIDCRERMSDTPINVVSTDLRDNGEVPIRASGRYLQPEITLDAGATWTAMQGFEVEGSPGGRQ